LIIEQDSAAIAIYEFYSDVTKALVGSANLRYDLDIPLIEIPVILEAEDNFLDVRTDRELAARKLNYVHFKYYLEKHFNGTTVSMDL
jgi:hypothetical protein